MPTLLIVPLSTPGNITLHARETIENADRLFLQTEEHPSARWIREALLPYTSMDDLYAQSEDFDALNAAIAARLATGGAVYAVPGRGVGQAQLAAICQAAAEAGTEVRVLSGPGYAEAAAEALPTELQALLCGPKALCPACALPALLDPSLPLCIEELDTPVRAAEVKLALAEYWPDETVVWLCAMNAEGAYEAHALPLYTLDRQAAYFAATVLFVPPVELTGRTRHGAEDLHAVMRRLRAPGGCPWDAEQTHESLRKSLLEETYEVLEALDTQDADALCEELGDLLLQIVFHALLEEEKSAFTLRDVTTGVVNKLIYRHPHVFSDVHVRDSEEVLVNWEQLKKKEKHMQTQSESIDAIPKAFPGLMRAQKVQKKAADVGFDWDAPLPALDKVREEAEEVRAALAQGSAEHILEELGDLLFACVNVVRLCGADSELALKAATDKFANRFKRMEAMLLAEGKSFAGMTLAQMDVYWERIKREDS